MHSERLLSRMFVISLLIHGIIILPRANFNPFVPKPKLQEIAVRYIKENPQIRPVPANLSPTDRQKLLPKSESFLKLDAKMIADRKRAPLPYVEQQNSNSGSKKIIGRSTERSLPLSQKGEKPASLAKPTFINSELLAIKKKISLPPIEMAKIDNPSYISYYQIVREKIRRSAYQNYTHNETGEVYASFIISNDGEIRDVRIAAEKTNANKYLQSIALRSIQDASPLPNFPKELDYPQLSFNIIISFEIE